LFRSPTALVLPGDLNADGDLEEIAKVSEDIAQAARERLERLNAALPR
jgi:hypothetical protein